MAAADQIREYRILASATCAAVLGEAGKVIAAWRKLEPDDDMLLAVGAELLDVSCRREEALAVYRTLKERDPEDLSPLLHERIHPRSARTIPGGRGRMALHHRLDNPGYPSEQALAGQAVRGYRGCEGAGGLNGSQQPGRTLRLLSKSARIAGMCLLAVRRASEGRPGNLAGEIRAPLRNQDVVPHLEFGPFPTALGGREGISPFTSQNPASARALRMWTGVNGQTGDRRPEPSGHGVHPLTMAGMMR